MAAKRICAIQPAVRLYNDVDMQEQLIARKRESRGEVDDSCGCELGVGPSAV